MQPAGNPRPGTFVPPVRYRAGFEQATEEAVTGRGLSLWLLGIALPIILPILALGGRHG